MKETLDITDPLLTKQWHPTKNGDLKPNIVTYGMRKKVWWLCENTCSHGCLHEWEEQIRIRQKNGCPFCAKHRLCIHDSIVFTHPEVAKQFHPTKNGDLQISSLTSGTLKKVWWLCENTNCIEKCLHEWKASVGSRCFLNKGCGCPYCSENGLHKVCIHNSIVYTHPNVAKEWHPIKNGDKLPSMFSYGCKLKFWWRCPNTCEKGCVHDFESKVLHRTKKGLGCPYCCEATRKVCEHSSLEYFHPEIAKEWHPTKNGEIKPENISKGSCKKYWWICKKGHEYEALLSNRTSVFQGCPICRNKTEEKLYTYLKTHFEDTIQRFTIPTCKNKRCLPFDFYIPQHNIIIELDGNHHFKQVLNWNSEKENFERDIFKMKKALDAGFKFIRIYQVDVLTSDVGWLDSNLLPKIINNSNIEYISKKESLYDKYKKEILNGLNYSL
jgi:very-short-patch-repair endonuclease